MSNIKLAFYYLNNHLENWLNSWKIIKLHYLVVIYAAMRIARIRFCLNCYNFIVWLDLNA